MANTLTQMDTNANNIATKLDEVEGKVGKMEGKLNIIHDNILAAAKAASAATRGNPRELKLLVAKIEKCKESGSKNFS